MIVSLNWLKKYTEIDLPIDQLVKLIGERLVEVEEVIDLGQRYKGIVVAQAKKVYKHPNADKLNVVELDDGGVTQNVERLENGLVQVVCGAPNVREGLLVAWLPPGTTVPSSFNDQEPFVLDARDLRGVKSNGMIGSGKELAINKDHHGIAELDADYTPGSLLAEVLELDDYLLDIENKSLTHRPDAFGLIGFAREVAAIQGKAFKSPDWLLATDPVLADYQPVQGINSPRVTIDDANLCSRYEAVVIAGVDSKKQSPLVIQSYLNRVGTRPISAVVDVTNYLMVTTGHPLHAFDYDAFLKAQNSGDAPDIKIRAGRDGEKLTLLDDRTVSLTSGDIVICAGDKPVGLAGAMGGSETEVTTETRNILLESATFNLYNLRSTSMRHGVFSDAVTRFTKGQSAEQTAPVMASAVRMLCDIAGGVRASQVVDEYPKKSQPQLIALTLAAVNNLLGTKLSIEDVKETLLHTEFTINPVGDDALDVLPPYWRGDIHIAEDLIEEVGRIRGFDSVEPTLPLRPNVAHDMTPFAAFQYALRKDLARFGANEVLTYSFVPAKLLESAQQNPAQAFKIVNALSPELQNYRLSLTPNLLDKVYGNLRQGYEQFALFELGKVHVKGVLDSNDDNLPAEQPRLGFVVAAGQKTAQNYAGPAYYQASYYLTTLLGHNNVGFELSPLDEGLDLSAQQLTAPFEPKRSAVVMSKTGKFMGVVGEYKKAVTKAFKLPNWSAGFELLTDAMFANVGDKSNYQPLSRYPGTEQDITLRVNDNVSYQQLASLVSDELKKQPYEAALLPLDIYKKSADDTYKNVTLRIYLNNHKSTITTEQASLVIEQVAGAATNLLAAQKI